MSNYGQAVPYQSVVGALTASGKTLVQGISAAEQQGALSDDDGTALYKAAKDTRGGQRQWWLELGITAGAGVFVGWLIGRAYK
jgi:hypothetical protein